MQDLSVIYFSTYNDFHFTVFSNKHTINVVIKDLVCVHNPCCASLWHISSIELLTKHED